MLIHNYEQASPEWSHARCGIPTSSCFSKIITSTGKPSTQAQTYAYEKAAEVIAGEQLEAWAGNQWTERGNELEASAVAYYEFIKDVETQKIGFATHDNGLSGASPDRLVGDDGLLEIKCPSPAVHMKYLVKNEVPSDYVPQVQGQLYITGRKWCDFMSYHPSLPKMIIRVERDEEFIEALHRELEAFSVSVKSIVDKIRANYE